MWIVLIVQSIVIGILFWLLNQERQESLQLLATYPTFLEQLIPYLPEKPAQRTLSYICMINAKKVDLLLRISPLTNLSQSWDEKDT